MHPNSRKGFPPEVSPLTTVFHFDPPSPTSRRCSGRRAPPPPPSSWGVGSPPPPWPRPPALVTSPKLPHAPPWGLAQLRLHADREEATPLGFPHSEVRLPPPSSARCASDVPVARQCPVLSVSSRPLTVKSQPETRAAPAAAPRALPNELMKSDTSSAARLAALPSPAFVQRVPSFLSVLLLPVCPPPSPPRLTGV